MQATAAVYVALLLLVGGCTADDTDEPDEPVEDPDTTLAAAEEVRSDVDKENEVVVTDTDVTKQSRLGTKFASRSRFPAGMIGYNRYYPNYSPDYYYPQNYPNYYPNPNTYYYPYYPSYPSVNYPSNNYYQPGYAPQYPYDYQGMGINEYSARHERA